MMNMQPAIPLSRIQRSIRLLIPVAAMITLGILLNIAPEGALGKLDAVGYAVCHRISARSFHVEGRQLPLCARCTGEFNAAGLALLFQFFISGRRSKLPSRSILAALVLFFFAFAIDGSNSYLYLLKQTSGNTLATIPNLYIPNNTLRLLTGTGMGIALAAVLYPIVNQTLWRELDARPALEWKSFLILIAILGGVDLLILTENPLVLYPIAFLSVFGVLALLSMVFGMLWIIIMHQDNTFTRLRELWLPAAAGFTLGLLLIIAMDLLRFRLTGTWSGFPGING
jgi:uncharacterized membrane protein